MGIRRKSIFLLTSISLLVACTDLDTDKKGTGGSGTSTGGTSTGGTSTGGTSTGGTSTGGTSTSTGGTGGSSIQIEKPDNAIDGQYLVLLDGGAVKPDMVEAVAKELLAPQSGVLLQTYNGSFMGFAANELDDTKALDMAKDPRIQGIAQDCVFDVMGAGVQQSASWNLDRIDSHPLALDGKYQYFGTGKGVNVYVIDTGIRANATDLQGRVFFSTGWVNDGLSPAGDDCHGHGTHVAGTIAGATYGVAKEATLYALRVADCKGKSSATQMIAAVEYVTFNHKNPAIANISMAGPKFSPLEQVIQTSIKSGVTYVAAAGNSGADACNYSPALVPEVITVGATDKTDTRVPMTNFGACVDLFAPGKDVVSIGLNGSPATLSGTSQAAPHVAGAAAIYLEANPLATPADVTKALLDGTTTGLVTGVMGSPNKLLYAPLTAPKTGFQDTKLWDTTFSDPFWPTKLSYWHTITYADVNGDKKMDACARSDKGMICALSNGMSFDPPTLWSNQYADDAFFDALVGVWQTIQYPDINGDGKADFCVRSQLGVRCYFSSGTKFGPGSAIETYFEDAGPWDDKPAYWGTIQFPDLNGDGKADVCGRAANGIVCKLFNGSDFDPPVVWTSFFDDGGVWDDSDAYWGTIHYPDLNGDGKADVCGRGPSGLICALSNGTTFDAVGQWESYYSDGGPWDDAPRYWATMQYADLNGDKKMDVCGRAANGLVCELSTGSAFSAPVTWLSFFDDGGVWDDSPAYWSSIHFQDINGDGKADVCGRAPGGIVCALSNGTGFEAISTWDTAFPDASGWGGVNNIYETIRFPDINGDGKADVCGRSSAGLQCGTAP